jgi:hypothetical protein
VSREAGGDVHLTNHHFWRYDEKESFPLNSSRIRSSAGRSTPEPNEERNEKETHH